MTSDSLQLKSPTDLINSLPPEAVLRVITAAAETAQNVIQMREISTARRKEIENSIALLRAKTDCQIERMDHLAKIIEILPDNLRAQVVDTICRVALEKG